MENNQHNIDPITQAGRLNDFIKKNGIMGIMCIWVIALQIQIVVKDNRLYDCYQEGKSFQEINIPRMDSSLAHKFLAVLPSRIKVIESKKRT